MERETPEVIGVPVRGFAVKAVIFQI